MRPLQLLFVIIVAALVAGCGTLHGSTTRFETDANLRLTAPAHRLVYQRGLDGTALLPIAGTSPWPGGQLQARLVSIGSTNADPAWQSLAPIRADGRFDERLRAAAGWYRLEVRVKTKGREARSTVERVGIGEVFIVVGHSVAQGGNTNLSGATDDRVNTIGWPPDSAQQRRDYERTADPLLLPPAVGVHFTDGVVPAPFGHGTYFWARFAEHVARTQDVPVLLLNAAFGGTSLEHWAKSAKGQSFEHGFVKSPLHMPYINLHHALRRYAAVTGVRAILADQGQNDWPEDDAAKVFTNYVAWVEQARADLGFPALAVVVNRASPPGDRPVIRRVQERMIHEIPHCHPGPDYDLLLPSDRYDAVHFSASGLPHAAQLWADALTPAFLHQATPFQPAAR